MRTRLYLYYVMMQPAILSREPKSRRRKLLMARHKLLTTP